MTITYRKYQFQPDFPFLYMQSTRTSSELDFIHFHNCLEIAVCEQGIMEWNIEGTKLRLHPGEFCILSPFVTHASHHPQQNSSVLCHYLFLEPEKLLADFYPNGLPEAFLWYRFQNTARCFSADSAPQIYAILAELIQEIQLKKQHFQLKISALSEYLMVALSRDINTEHIPVSALNSHARSMIFPAISWIDKNYHETISPQHLSALCKMAPRRFNRLFLEAIGKTPTQYIRQVKVQKACDLLLQTEDSILDIAYSCGFSSVTTFNRCFLKQTGQTPSAFRNDKRIYRKNQTTYSPYQDA